MRSPVLVKVWSSQDLSLGPREDAGFLLSTTTKAALVAADVGPVLLGMLKRAVRAYERVAQGLALTAQEKDDRLECANSLNLTRLVFNRFDAERLAERGVAAYLAATDHRGLVPLEPPAIDPGPFIGPLVTLLGFVEGKAFVSAALVLTFSLPGCPNPLYFSAIEAGVLRHLASALDPAAGRDMTPEGVRMACIFVKVLAETASPATIPRFRAAGLFPLLEAAVRREPLATHVLDFLRALERTGGGLGRTGAFI